MRISLQHPPTRSENTPESLRRDNHRGSGLEFHANKVAANRMHRSLPFRERRKMRDSQSVQQRVVVALVGAGLVLLGKASGLFGSGAKLNIPVLVLVVAALMVLFVHPWIRQEQDNKAQSALTSKQVTVSAVVVIGLALAVKMAVDAFWGKVPEYRFLLMGSGAMVVLFLLPLARERRK